MAPWDENQYFDTPLETLVAVGTQKVSLVKANPNRVALIISNCTNVGSLYVGTGPNVGNAAAHILTQQAPRIEIYQKTSGPWCAQEWFAIGSAAGGNAYVTEIILRTLPNYER